MIRKHATLFLALLLMVFGCASTEIRPEISDIDTAASVLSKQIYSSMPDKQKRKIAVMNLPLQTGEMTDLGLYLSEKLANDLFQYRDKIEVMERSNLKTVLKEAELGLTGIIDDKTAQSVGKVTGADAVVIGKMTDLGSRININVRVIGAEQANVLAIAEASLIKNNEVKRLLGEDVENEKDVRLREFKSLVNRGVMTQPGKQNIAVVIASPKSSPAESVIYNSLKQGGNVNIILDLFKEEPFKAKFFEGLYNGNTDMVKKSGALRSVDGLILGKLSYSFRGNTGVGADMVSCDIKLSYKFIDSGGNIVRSDSISVVGPGFTEDAALERGMEILGEKYSDRILKP